MNDVIFTIKQVTKDPYNPNIDRVRLWAARDVFYGVNPALVDGSEEFGNPPNLEPQVMFTMPDGAHCSIDFGTIFVMNASGKTVDTYRLRGSEQF